jgi:hypothetical protein
VSYAEKEAKLTHEDVRFYTRLGTVFLIGAVSMVLLFTFVLLGVHP